MSLRRIMLAPPRNAMMAAMLPCERRMLSRIGDASVHESPVFIVGPPRSGTTLLYETLVTRFRFSYFSNAAHRIHRTPAVATSLFKSSIRNWRGAFKSEYGKIKGWGAPCEAGWIWDRWMSGLRHSNSDRVDHESVLEMQRTIKAIANLIDAPFLGKNVDLSECLTALDHVFPGCVFLHIQRSEADCIRSIYRLRKKRLGADRMQEWLSVKPKGWKAYRGAEPIRQIAAQVFGVHQDIRNDASLIGAHRVHGIDYEALCENPNREMNAIEAFLNTSRVTIERRDELPRQFERPAFRPLEARLERMISESIEHWKSAPSSVDGSPVKRAA
ncbi:MAG: sulfotransferase [Planctomycetota bacterium]|nr:sulfotransferase [Planctomycetota bacterium]